MPWRAHQARSSPVWCNESWCPLHNGTVNSSDTLSPLRALSPLMPGGSLPRRKDPGQSSVGQAEEQQGARPLRARITTATQLLTLHL